MGRRVKVGRVRKPCLGTLHWEVFEAKTVKGTVRVKSPVFRCEGRGFFLDPSPRLREAIASAGKPFHRADSSQFIIPQGGGAL